MRTLLIDVFKRLTPWNKSIDIYSNDIDNAYPERMDRLINNSVTARSAANIMVQYIIGNGFGEADNFIVNKSKNLKLIDFADDLANSLVRQRGAFIHINWNANFKQSDFSLIPFEWGRIGKKDSNEYHGKIAIFKDWTGEVKKDKILKIDVFNPDPKVIKAQIRKAGSWDKYKGQILYINMDSQYDYPLSIINSVQQDCDSEAQAQIYKNTLLRKGFFGSTLVVTRPLIGDDLEEGTAEYLAANSERTQFQTAMKKMLGAQNAGGVTVLEMDFAGEKLEDAILVKQLDSKIDDKLFNYTETSVRENILIAFNNLPIGLIKASEGVFGNSGESLKEMKKTYWENTSKERALFETIINDLLERTEGYAGGKVQVIKLIEDDANQVGNAS